MSKIPIQAEEVTEYDNLYNIAVRPFFNFRYSSLIVLGRPGLGKSYMFTRWIDEAAYLIKGWARPVQTMIDIYQHRNKLLVFDDAESLFKTDLGRAMGRSLTENTQRKIMMAKTTNPDLKKAGVPSSFTTTSKCVFLVNNFRFGSSDEADAILDRSHVLYFNPSSLEVHKQVGNWLWPEAQDIFDFVGERLHMLNNHSMRTYVKLWERKQARGDWKEMLYNRFCLPANLRLVQELEADWRIGSVEEKVAKFIEAGGGVRSTYYYIKRQLIESGQLLPLDESEIPRIKLSGQKPEELDPEQEILDVHGKPALEGCDEPCGDSACADDEDAADWKGDEPRRGAPQEPSARRALDDLPERERLRQLIARVRENEDWGRVEKLTRQLKELREDEG